MKLTSRKLELPLTADEIVVRLLNAADDGPLCLLDSCGVSHLGSHFLIAGFGESESREFGDDEAAETLRGLDDELERDGRFGFLTLSYDFGLKLQNIEGRDKSGGAPEPDVFAAFFTAILVHDYDRRETFVAGRENAVEKLAAIIAKPAEDPFAEWPDVDVTSNVTRDEYLALIAEVQEEIRAGRTYQTNLTQRLTARLPADATPAAIFARLRRRHPAPFASFFRRRDSVVVSASPERFFRIDGRVVSTSPIKGTRPRGRDAEEDSRIVRELAESEKDRAENVMIVDLLRNDLGRICEFGSVEVEKLCEPETHPSLHHLVSTISGELRRDVRFSEILRAVFPCGSITGAPKISTMRIIDRLESVDRGLSMGAIGFARGVWENADALPASLPDFDLAVAIRTMTIRGSEAVFHVGGGIVIDSVAADEYDETLTKAGALLDAIRGRLR